jgi:glycosyltransferase 2 family protein
MKIPWRKLLYWLGILLGGGIFIYQIWQGGQAVFSRTAQVSQPAYLGWAWVSILLANALQISAWRYLMRGLGVALSWREVLEGYSISLLPRYIPGSVWGYISRAEWLRQDHQVPYSLTNLGSVLEVLLILISVVLVVGIYLITVLQHALWWGVLLLLLAIPFLSWRLFYYLLASRLFRRLLPKAAESQPLFRLSLPLWTAILGLHLLAWLFYGVSISLLTQVFGLPPQAGLLGFTFIFAGSWLAGFLVLFVPSGLGVREQTLSTWLSTQLRFSAGQASAVSVLSRLGISLVELFWLAIGLSLRQLRRSGSVKSPAIKPKGSIKDR